jgi:hypothetical protein
VVNLRTEPSLALMKELERRRDATLVGYTKGSFPWLKGLKKIRESAWGEELVETEIGH